MRQRQDCDKRDQAERQLARIQDENHCKTLMIKLNRRYFAKLDAMLDTSQSGPLWLIDERVAQIVADAIHYREGKSYALEAYSIMPNHVHLVITPNEIRQRDSSPHTFPLGARTGRRDSSPYILTSILENLKWYTALKSNEILRRSGQFWQHESYDHVIRNAHELERVIRYVINNPVKAGLVKNWRDWKWTYCKGDSKNKVK